MNTEDMNEVITDFVDKNYPKGTEERGFAILILALFLLEFDKNKKWNIIKKKKSKQK